MTFLKLKVIMGEFSLDPSKPIEAWRLGVGNFKGISPRGIQELIAPWGLELMPSF